jgi:preprotein translocase subunit SecE
MTDDSVQTTTEAEQAPDETSQGSASELDSAVPAQLGAQRYVLAAFFTAGIAVTFVFSKVLAAIWTRLAESAWVAQHVPFVSVLGEEERSEWSMIVAAVFGLVTIVRVYRRPLVRTWTSEVGSELAKVTWPSKKEVTNSTMVVILASAFATVFLALLDRFWGFVTDLVYKG